VYTNLDTDNMVVSRVIVFNGEDESTNALIKWEILHEEGNKGGYRTAERIITRIYGSESYSIYDAANYRADGGEVGGRKGTNRSGTAGEGTGGRVRRVTNQQRANEYAKSIFAELNAEREREEQRAQELTEKIADGEDVEGVSRGTKFQLAEPVEIDDERDLVAVHNLTEYALRESLALGGIPSPSIAIVKAEQGHTNFGEISLVFDKSTIDPKANKANKVYGSDAWTPTKRGGQ
jgi:hypothetical protein